MRIARLTPLEELTALGEILVDAVDSGASVGFLAPLPEEEAARYWRGVGDDVLVWGAWLEGRLEGVVQLHLAQKQNGLHRAEIAKLLVHRRARRRGLGRALMLAAQDEARRLGRTTLVLDTRAGDPSEALYQSLGWERVGEIPCYARGSWAEGTGERGLEATAIYYLLL